MRQGRYTALRLCLGTNNVTVAFEGRLGVQCDDGEWYDEEEGKCMPNDDVSFNNVELTIVLVLLLLLVGFVWIACSIRCVRRQSTHAAEDDSSLRTFRRGRRPPDA